MMIGMRGLGQCDPADPTCIELPPVDVGPISTPPIISVPIDLNPLGLPSGDTVPITTNPPSIATTTNPVQIANAVATAANAAISAYKSTQSPYLIPGTNLVANPGGVPIGSALGITGTQLTGLSTSLAPILILGLGLIVVMSFAGGKR
jgi:hypothetical protein